MPPASPLLPTARRARHRRPIAAAALAAATLAGCGDSLLEVTSRNNLDTFAFEEVVYPFSTAAASLPTALAVSEPQTVGVLAVRPSVVARAVGNTTVLVPNFDLVFDVAADGRVRLIPSQLIAGLSTTGRQLRAGVRVVNTPFDSLASAPTGDYESDSVTTVRAGQTLALDLESAFCLGSTRPSIFAKIVVDSVSAATGGVHIRGRVDPNCGYRSLVEGKPTS